MKLKILSSNSDGNSYLLVAENGETLGVECGVNFNDIKKALNFDLSNLNLIVSHSHGDHSKGIKEAINNGVEVYSSPECFNEIGVKSHRANPIQDGKLYQIGNFRILPFDVVHDVRCFGFVIQHEEMGVTMFVTDTMYVPNRIKGLNNVIIEANYCEDIIEEKTDKQFLVDRVKKSHLSIQNCIKCLQANDLSNVNNIVLIHLSNTNSDAVRFKKDVETATGKRVTIADKGVEIDFNKSPF